VRAFSESILNDIGRTGPHGTLSVSPLSVGSGLSPMLLFLLGEVRRDLCRNPQEAPRSESEVAEVVYGAAARHGIEISSFERDEILLQIEREDRPFGVLQELVDNQAVSDIIITSFEKIEVQCGRRTFSTSLRFADQSALESFVERLLLKAGTSYSTKRPIVDGMIGSQARIHAVHQCLCDSGPYITIRLNRMSAVTMQEVLSEGLAPAPILGYLERMVRAGLTVFIAGEVGTGKTTLARALASAMPAEDSILCIEDTPEIRLEHPHVRYITTRDMNSEGAGRVPPSECIRAGMRMAMNRIIFGEIRDAEAAEAFIDVCASGHPGLSTIHARSALESVLRLELFLGRAQRGAERRILLEQICSAVQVIVYLNMCRISGRRRIFEVREIGPVADDVVRQRELFRYECRSGTPQWRVVHRSSAHRDILESDHDPLHLSDLPPVLQIENLPALRVEQRSRGGGA
jgi:pilus assembly protein CpaF